MDSGLVGLLSGVVVLATAIVGYMAAKQRADSAEILRGVQEVHVLVNDQMTVALDRIDQLDAALRAAGIDSPDRPDRD